MAEIKAGIDCTFISKFGSKGSGDGQFNGVSDVCVSPIDGSIFVVSNDRVQVFSTDGKFVRRFAADKIGPRPRGIAFDSNGEVIITESTPQHRVQVFKHDGAWLRAWGKEGADNGDFNTPYQVAVDGKGLVVVADGNNHRIQIFNRDGTFIRAIGKQGRGDGEFNYVHGVAGYTLNGVSSCPSPLPSVPSCVMNVPKIVSTWIR